MKNNLHRFFLKGFIVSQFGFLVACAGGGGGDGVNAIRQIWAHRC